MPKKSIADSLKPARNRHVGVLSPLRYAGGKRRLAKYVAAALQLNGIRPKLFVEPFAGGASVSLHMLQHDLVDLIALGEKDELVAAFWQTVFFDTEWLLRAIARTKPTLENWNRIKKGPHKSIRERALACIFLNRTSFSGLLTADAGPIGGYEQQSEYKIDCRYAQEEIMYRISLLGKLSERVCFVNEADWQETINSAQQRGLAVPDVFYYFDPPYFHKAEKLYRLFFTLPDHESLARQLQDIGSPWVLSYDAALPILQMYRDYQSQVNQVELLYSINNNSGLLKAQELIVSNLPQLPDEYKSFSQRVKSQATQEELGSSEEPIRAVNF